MSCLAQDYKNLEVIVVDDKSDAEHLSLISEVASLDPRIRLVLLKESVGACAARNKAISLARGEFITGLDDDDEFTPGRVSLLLKHWSMKPYVSFLCTGYRVVAKNLDFVYGRRSRAITWQHLLAANYVGNQIFTKTNYLRQIGGFDIKMTSCQDYDTWLRLSQHYGSGLRIGQPSYVVHQDHDEQRISQGTRRAQGYLMLLEKHQQYMSKSQLKSQYFYRMLYTENKSALHLLLMSNRFTFGVAVKNLLLRAVVFLKGKLV